MTFARRLAASLFFVWALPSVALAIPPLVRHKADPCSEVCTFTFCLVGGPAPLDPNRPVRFRECADCGDVRIQMMPTYAGNAWKPLRVRLGSAAVRLQCEANAGPCRQCQSDSDCDDGDPATADVCVDSTVAGRACVHGCPSSPGPFEGP